MSDDRKVCGRCLDWNQGTVTPRQGYCRVHDRFKEYSDTCDQFRVSQWFADQAELAALRARAERAEACVRTARAEALRDGFDAGFAASGEGWNGDFPEAAQDAYYRERREELLSALVKKEKPDGA